MTVSIFRAMARLPSGDFATELTPEELAVVLHRQCGTEAERDRNEHHVLRDVLFRDGGVQYMKDVIGRVFKDPDVIRLRQEWVEFARFNNPIKRIVNELSTVYAKPATRTVDGDANNAAYQSIIEETRFNEVMFQAGRLLNLHRALLVGFRVKERADGVRVPLVDIATPANVRAVLDPSDPTEVIGWLIKNDFRPARAEDVVAVPAWTLWTAHERAFLRSNFSIIEGTYIEHGLGVCPWVPVTLSPPGAGFWPGEEGKDLVAAHVAIWFSNVLRLKETKSATKLQVLQGDASMAARGQMADSEGVTELPDGTAVSSIDTSMDLDMFSRSSNQTLEDVGHNYGLTPAQINHQGVQSAEARELMRIPLRELREQQQVPLRIFERQFAIAQAAVLAKDLPERAFTVDGWRIDFAEAGTPLTGTESLVLFEKERAAGLTDTVEFLMQRNPDMTPEQAADAIQLHITRETARVGMMRTLQAMSGAMGTLTPDRPADAAPQIFGASDGDADNDEEPEPDEVIQ